MFDAPRDLVFRAWTDEKLLARWWGPKGFTNSVCELDVIPGGAIRVEMRGPSGTVYPMGGTLLEIREPERLVFTSTASFRDQKGGPDFENLNTVTFEEEGGKTKITLHVHVTVIRESPAVAMALGGMEMGWSQSLDKLAAVLK